MEHLRPQRMARSMPGSGRPGSRRRSSTGWTWRGRRVCVLSPGPWSNESMAREHSFGLFRSCAILGLSRPRGCSALDARGGEGQDPLRDTPTANDSACSESPGFRRPARRCRPRPGDGTPAYVDQLHPERIDDAALEARLADFETLGMSTSELDGEILPARARDAARSAAAGASAPRAGRHPERRAGGDRADTMATPDRPGQNPRARRCRPRRRMAQAAAQTVLNELMQAQDAARGAVGAAARGSADGLLVQPLQRVRRQGTGARST